MLQMYFLDPFYYIFDPEIHPSAGNNPVFFNQKYPNLTKMFLTTQTEDLI